MIELLDDAAATIAPASAPRALDERRKLGAYYTPERVSEILSNWAIRNADDTVLEPSFGGCGFLAAARKTLKARGANDPVSQIFGCDIDQLAFDHLAEILNVPEGAPGFVKGDFLECTGETGWPETFSVVLANPPYIPHHRMGMSRVRELWAREQGIPGVRGRAGLWAYFVSHAVGMLAVGGRMAWVLPGAFLQADYAAPIRSFLGRRFERCAAFLIRERIFLTEGTDEETVIVLADGFLEADGEGEIRFGEAAGVDELERLVTKWTAGAWQGIAGVSNASELTIAPTARAMFDRIAASGHAKKLGEVAKVQIGLVTGDNAFFVLTREVCAAHEIEEADCRGVLTKFRAAQGLELTTADLDDYADKGGRTLLISVVNPDPASPVAAYLDTYDAERIKTVSTFRKRAVWSASFDGKVPDAFLPVMHHEGPRLVLNGDELNCTNTIHRVYFARPSAVTARRVAAISMLTTFSQISAELVGRRYGSGVLKHEPRDAEAIRVLLPDPAPSEVATAFKRIDAALRKGDPEAARRLADGIVFAWCGLGLADSDLETLSVSLNAIRARRRPERRLGPMAIPHLA